MKITWLGQASLFFETGDCRILIDPYFSNSCQRLNPASYRRTALDPMVRGLKPTVVICTHDHQDHYDEESLDMFLKDTAGITCMVPPSCFAKIRHYGPGHNYIWFPADTVWTEGSVRFTAVKACHSDPEAIGILIEAEGKTYYVTGDTLYHKDIFKALPEEIEAVFLPVNGVGNNMNFTDARAFINKTGAKKAVPLHLGMLDDRSVTEFSHPKAVIPSAYQEVKL